MCRPNKIQTEFETTLYNVSFVNNKRDARSNLDILLCMSNKLAEMKKKKKNQINL